MAVNPVAGNITKSILTDGIIVLYLSFHVTPESFLCVPRHVGNAKCGQRQNARYYAPAGEIFPAGYPKPGTVLIRKPSLKCFQLEVPT